MVRPRIGRLGGAVGVATQRVGQLRVPAQENDRVGEFDQVAGLAQHGALVANGGPILESVGPQAGRQNFADLLQVAGDNAGRHAHVFEQLGGRTEEAAVHHVGVVRRDEDVAGLEQPRALLLRHLAGAVHLFPKPVLVDRVVHQRFLVAVADQQEAGVRRTFANQREGLRQDVDSFDPLEALVKVELDSWQPVDCDLCKREIPVNTDVGHGKEYLAQKSA